MFASMQLNFMSERNEKNDLLPELCFNSNAFVSLSLWSQFVLNELGLSN
jgi:hypothetical protein